MKKTFLISFLFLAFTNLFGQTSNPNFVSDDIDNFWIAYDKIVATTDSAQQYQHLNKLYIEKASVGLKALMEVRQYTPQDYIHAINNYPLFWSSIRQNTLKSKGFTNEIELEILKLKGLYPALKPAKMYFVMGALRTPGTTRNGMVLIGSEIALTDKNTISTEFPEAIASSRSVYFASNPIDNTVLLNVHEYVHTQQKPIVNNLLSQCLYEGVAEFISVLATGKPSSTPAVNYGKANKEKVKHKFEQDMFAMNKQGYWLWSDLENEFKTRDLGYYIGYALCEKYYDKAENKKQAIKAMIELDYTDEEQIEKFVDGTKYFSTPLNDLYQAYEKSRPRVISISQFKNGSQNVNPNLTEITINFSASMNKNHRGFDYGPLGENNVLRVKNVVGFSADGKSFTFEVELKPNQKYQSLVSNSFRSATGISLKPYLIDLKTAGN